MGGPRPPERVALRRALGSWDGFLALGFGAGLSPIAPGTAGTAVAIPLAWWLKQLPGGAYAAVLLLALVMGAWVCDRVGRRLGVTDHGALVWDEILGYWIAAALVPLHWGWLIAAFFLFRFFDILKPWPVRLLERRVPGGWGVMLDDVAAGLMALGTLWLAGRWWPV